MAFSPNLLGQENRNSRFEQRQYICFNSIGVMCLISTVEIN